MSSGDPIEMSQFDDAEEEDEEANADKSESARPHPTRGGFVLGFMDTSGDGSDSSSSGFNDDDPRLQTLFATEPYPRPSLQEAAESTTMEQQQTTTHVVDDENVMIQCFEWSIQQHSIKDENALGFWVAPDDQSIDYEEEEREGARIRYEIQQWKPKVLTLPPWAVQEKMQN